MIKQVSLADWNITIEKKDLGILFTCIKKKPTYNLYLELYHVPQNIIVLFDTLEDLWTYLKNTDKYSMEENTLKVAFTFGIRQKQISFHMKGNQSQLIEKINRLEEDMRVISLRFKELIGELREDNRRKDNFITDQKRKINSLLLEKGKCEEPLNQKSIFNEYLMSIKAQSQPKQQPKSQLFASPSIDKDIFNAEKNPKLKLSENSNNEKNLFGSLIKEQQKKQMDHNDIKLKNQNDELIKIEQAQKERRRKRKEKKNIRIS